MDIKSLILKNHEKLKHLDEEKMNIITQNWLDTLERIKNK